MANRYHHGALAEAMVGEALSEVRSRGAEEVSLRHVAQAVGVSPSAAYNHFADKDDLLRAVGVRGHDELDARMAEAVAAHPGRSDAAAIARFRALGEAYISFALAEPHLFRLTFGPLCFLAPAGAEESSDVDGDSIAGPFVRLQDALADLHQRGLLREGVGENLDLAVWSAVHGLCVLMLEGAVPVESAASLLDAIARLVLVRPAGGRRPRAAARAR